MTTPIPITAVTVHSAREAYDAIMRLIEPELTSGQIPLLAERYKDETPENRGKRVAWYNKAFAEYDKAAAELLRQFKTQAEAHRRNALQSAEHATRKKEEQDLLSLESQFV